MPDDPQAPAAAQAPENQDGLSELIPILQIADFIADPVRPADFPKAVLRFRNDRAAHEIGLADLSHEHWTAHFGRFAALAGNLRAPLALRYHGHQFQTYNPDIGDGRGFLFAQVRALDGRLMDLGTKGSGQTPYSRFGDGRLTLKGAVREILATEMLEALGVETSRTFSVIETGEELMRNDEPSPTRSAVMVRLNHGHIRFGSFQRLAALDQHHELERLVLYCLDQYFGGKRADDGNHAALLLEHAVAGMARMAASFMAAGFVHGVLNTDNMNITGESFDYGPWRFTPKWTAGFTAAYFDHSGLYAFARQPDAIYWNLGQLAVALRPLSDAEPLVEKLEAYPDLYRAALADRFLWRMGIAGRDLEQDLDLVRAAERAMVEGDMAIDQFFFAHRGGRIDESARNSDMQEFHTLLAGYSPRADTLAHPYWSGDAPQSMHIEEVEAIWSAIDQNDDWQPLYDKVDAVRAMGMAHTLSGTA